MTYQDTIEFSTEKHGHMHDLTEEVRQVVSESGIAKGTAHIFNKGSTAVIGTIEYELGLERDLPRELNRLIPPGVGYAHEDAWHDGNGHSHLQASILGPEVTVPVVDGTLFLGTWQQIFHHECDNKPRQRVVLVTVMGE